jgi:nucleoside-diphosphate-sugar epimerase
MPRRVDVVFHTAYNTSLWQGDAGEQTRLNVFGTRNMVRAALEMRARRFVHSSHILAYGLHSGTITEETPSRASRSSVNLIRSMAQAEREVRRGLRQGLPAVILNPANMLGPHDLHAWGRIIQLIQQRQIVGAPAGGGSFCHVRPVALAHVRAATDGRIGHNYLLGGADLTYVRLVNLLGRELHRPTLPKPLPSGLLNGYARMQELLFPLLRRKPDITRDMIEILSAHSYCRSRKAQSELGYQPATVEEMIQDSVGWLQKK